MDKADVKHFKTFMQANQGRRDVTPEHVDLLIKQLDQRLADPRLKAKHAHYAAQKAEIEGVKRIMDMED